MPEPNPHFLLPVGTQVVALVEVRGTDGKPVHPRGAYRPPADMHWSLYGVPEQLENPQTEEAYWEIQKFLTMALKANPNVLECLWTPMVEHANEIAREMLAMRERFLSKLVYQTY